MTNTQEQNYLRGIHKIALALQGFDKKLGTVRVIERKLEEDDKPAEDSREKAGL